MLQKFRDFAMRGNVVDLAIGVIIGVAFGKIVESMVGDIFMPIIGAISGGVDFSNYFTPLTCKVPADVSLADAKKQCAIMAWGNFVTIVINFLIVALALFAVINLIQRLRKKEEGKTAAAPPRQEILLEQIRDLLAKK